MRRLRPLSQMRAEELEELERRGDTDCDVARIGWLAIYAGTESAE